MFRYLSLSLSLVLCACEKNEPHIEVEMRVFDVAQDQALYASTAVNTVLDHNGGVGSAERGPNGSLIVIAPPTVLDGVQGLVDKLAEAGAEARPPRNVSVRYWIVSGEPAGDFQHSDALAPLAEVLGTIANAEGPQHFELVAGRTLHTMESGRGVLEEERLHIEQRLHLLPDGKRVRAKISVYVESVGKIETEIALEPDRHAVIAAAGSEGGNRYVIVRPQIR